MFILKRFFYNVKFLIYFFKQNPRPFRTLSYENYIDTKRTNHEQGTLEYSVHI